MTRRSRTARTVPATPLKKRPICQAVPASAIGASAAASPPAAVLDESRSTLTPQRPRRGSRAIHLPSAIGTATAVGPHPRVQSIGIARFSNATAASLSLFPRIPKPPRQPARSESRCATAFARGRRIRPAPCNPRRDRRTFESRWLGRLAERVRLCSARADRLPAFAMRPASVVSPSSAAAQAWSRVTARR